MKYLLIDLYTGKSKIIAEKEKIKLTQTMERVEGDRWVYKGEEHMIVVLQDKE